jgi:hypothetical protein
VLSYWTWGGGIPERCDFHPCKGFSMEKKGPNWPNFAGFFFFSKSQNLHDKFQWVVKNIEGFYFLFATFLSNM